MKLGDVSQNGKDTIFFQASVVFLVLLVAPGSPATAPVYV